MFLLVSTSSIYDIAEDENSARMMCQSGYLNVQAILRNTIPKHVLDGITSMFKKSVVLEHFLAQRTSGRSVCRRMYIRKKMTN